jgi:hypothetical protein
MYGGRDTANHQWVDSVPGYRVQGAKSPIDQTRLEDFRAVAHQVVGALFDTLRLRKIENTDVFGTLSRAADYAKASRSRQPVLILLSDMENSTPDLRMERENGVPATEWIETRRISNRLPDMRGICVVVAGAAASSSHQAKIRDFWFAYFASAGARFPNSSYRSFIADASELHC